MRSPKAFIGIDPAAETFAAALFRDPDTIVESCDNFVNQDDGFKQLESWLAQRDIDLADCIICVESTGVYNEHLCHYLYRRGYAVYLEAPQKVKRAFKINGPKTDRVDATQIAEYAFRFQDKLKAFEPKSYISEQLNAWLSARELLVGHRTALVNALKAYRRKVNQTTVIVDTYQEQIEQLKTRIKSIERSIDKLIEQNPQTRQIAQRLRTIPSIARLTSANLVAITNEFTELTEYKKLAAHLGICPYPYTSGKSVRKKTKSTRQGPPRLRKLLHLAAKSLIAKNDKFKQYYARKKTQGKPPLLILNNIANKLLRICCAIIHSQQQYDKNYVSINPNFLK